MWAKLCWSRALRGLPGTDPKQLGASLGCEWGFAAEKLQKRQLQLHGLLISIVMVTAYMDLHSNRVTTSSCLGLPLPHLCNNIQAGSVYVTPSWFPMVCLSPGRRICQQVEPHGSAGTGSTWQAPRRKIDALPQHSSSSAPNSSTKKSLPLTNCLPWSTHTSAQRFQNTDFSQSGDRLLERFLLSLGTEKLAMNLLLSFGCQFKGAPTWIPPAILK